MRYVCAALVALLLGACSQPRGPQFEVFLLEAKALPTNATLCISVDGSDYHDLTLLQSEDERFVSWRDCTRNSDIAKGSFHTATGRPAYFIDLHNFRPGSDGAGEIEVDIYHHRQWAIHKSLAVQRTDGAWVVSRVLLETQA